MNTFCKDPEIARMARKKTDDFLKNSTDYQMGYIEAEQPHPLTKNMSDVFKASVADGVRLIAQCDALLSEKLSQTLQSETYLQFEKRIAQTLRNGGRVIAAGCGSSGRLCMRVEASFRSALKKYAQKYPMMEKKLSALSESVLSLMTGGDYTVIRAVELFEDYISVGRRQAAEMNLDEKDLLVGVTATGETTSILGMAAQALDDGAGVWMLICSHPDQIIQTMPRAKQVYGRYDSSYLYLPCGPMALTGSTRMQSSTYEQAVFCIAVDRALAALLAEWGADEKVRPLSFYAAAFAALADQLLAPAAVNAMKKQVDLEEECYEHGGLITYFADEFMLDTLTDTTERAPTFQTPPYAPQDQADAEQPWSFVKNPEVSTPEAWRRCFAHEPRCIRWEDGAYHALGITEEVIRRIPAIDLPAMYRFAVGNAPCEQREKHPESIAVWIGSDKAPASFAVHAARYAKSACFTIEQAGITPTPTAMDIFEHLAMKLLLNNFSTATMVRMGRVVGNYMVYLMFGNKKCVDRASRIVSQLCSISYEEALEELFYTHLYHEQKKTVNRSSVQETIHRLQTRRERL